MRNNHPLTRPQTKQTPEHYLASPDSHRVTAALESAPGSSKRQALTDEYVSRAQEARKSLDAEVDNIVDTIRAVDPFRLLGALHGLDSLRRQVLSGAENFGSDAMLEFFAGLITAQPEVAMHERVGEPFDPQLVASTDAALRRVANLQSTIDLSLTLESAQTEDHPTLNMLRMEYHFDRMAGFDPHVRRLVDAVFGEIDDLARDEVGFRLSDAVRFADLYGQRRMQHVAAANRWLDEEYPPFDPGASPQEQMQWRAGHLTWFSLISAPPLEDELSAALADHLDVPPDEFALLADAMAVTIGTQSVRRPSDSNELRKRPLVRLTSGEWHWCRPVDFIHGIFDWALDVSSRSSRLLTRYDAARQRAAERLPAELLADVFGARAHRNVTYPVTESAAEIDTLITLPGANLVIESKGGRFSPAARRGAPRRVERHARDLIEKAADQNARAIAAIALGVPFTTAERTPLHLSPTSRNLGVIVTFDRVDPFATHLGTPTDGSRTERSWVVALADLLLITEVLPTPTEFYAYTAHRVEMVRSGETAVFVEADALGAWCLDRLTNLTPIPGSTRPDAPRSMVSTTSSWMNDYYTVETLRAMGVDADEVEEYIRDTKDRQGERKPRPGVPTLALEALDALLRSDDETWPLRARQALSVLPKEWRPFARLVSTASRGPAGRAARKRLRRGQEGFRIAQKFPVRVLTKGEEPPDDTDFVNIVVDSEGFDDLQS